MKIYTITCLLFAALLPGYYAFTQNIKIVTNQVGYDLNEVKHAVIVAEHADSIGSFQLLDKKWKAGIQRKGRLHGTGRSMEELGLLYYRFYTSDR